MTDPKPKPVKAPVPMDDNAWLLDLYERGYRIDFIDASEL